MQNAQKAYQHKLHSERFKKTPEEKKLLKALKSAWKKENSKKEK